MLLFFQSALESMEGDIPGIAEDSDSEEEAGGDDGEDDAEGGDEKKTVSEHDKYIVPLDVEAHIKLLWNSHADILDFIWSRAVNGGSPSAVANPDGWKLFFQRVVLVPPNRFRPLSKVGEGSAEHPQNVNLSKIIETNEKIRRILLESARDQPLAALTGVAVSDTLVESAADVEIDEDGVLVAAPTASPAANTGLSRIVTLWIELQNSVNCYIDSAKNPNPLATSDVAGIRQILERKEGLFRRNMMGKRVNFCCRSVISPDPYIGANEVGVPVIFAKALHYPTPVNDWNVKYLRKLVEAGPHEYPGELSYISI